MRPRRFHQYVEKVDINVAWRVMHVFCFIGIAISSMEGAFAFCEIYDIFNYRCILYAKVSTKLTGIEFKNKTDIPPSSPSITENKVDMLVDSEEVKDSMKSANNPKMHNLNLKLNLGIFESDYYIEVGTNTRKLNFEQAKPVPGVPHIYIYDDELWLSNETMTARAHVGMTSTVFATVMMCNFVILVPFIGFVVAAVFTFIVLLFRRTHRGLIDSVPADWLYVYPLAIVTSTMTILAVVALNLVYNGLNAFCAHFVHFTGQNRCSPLLDYFTKEQKLGRRDLYRSMKLSQNCFFISTMFWIAQLVVILMRIFCSVDFYLIKVLIRKKSRFDDEDYDDEDYFDVGEYEFAANSQMKLIDLVRELKAQKQDKNKARIIPDITIAKYQ